jgi:CSLREA domain-containing protein
MSIRLSIPALILALLAAAPASAATWVVTRLDDPEPGACLPEDCSLREAIHAANAGPGADQILLGPGVHQLERGELVASEALEVAGIEGGTTIRGDGVGNVLRLAPDVAGQLRNLILHGPSPFGVPDTALLGSIPDAVRVDAGGSLTMENVVVTLGGGRVVSSGTYASMDLRHSVLLQLQCGHQSGLCRSLDTYMQLLSVSGGDVEFRRSVVTGGLVPAIDSGASIVTSGDVLFDDSRVIDTHGGLSFQAQIPRTVTLRRFRYHGNSEPLLARLPATVTIVDADFADNRNRWSGEDAGPAAIHAYAGASFDIERTSFIGNLGSGSEGGAILVEGNASLRLVNSTFSGNSFTVEAAAGGARGAAVAARAGNTLTRVEIIHTTLVAPLFMPTGISGSALSATGADAQLQLSVHNSIVRGSCNLGLVPGHMDDAQGSIKSSGDDCGFNPVQNQTGIANAAMDLGSLGDHGAVGRTYMPGPTSVAIDTAAPGHCAELDQRRYQRLLPGVLCDVGAIEVEGIDRLFADGFEG